jgi:hypothetical protein
MDNLVKVKYQEVKVGSTFKLGKKDNRVFRKEKEGGLLVKDKYGFPCESEGHKVYCYLTMPVWVEQEESEDNL